MARLFTAGAELQSSSIGVEDPNFNTIGTVSINTSNARSGTACYSVVSNSAVFAAMYTNVATVVGTDYYVRGCFKLSALPAGVHSICMDGWTAADTGGQRAWSVEINGAGNVGINDGTQANIYQTTNTPVSANVYTVIEVHFKTDSTGLAGTLDLKVDGVVKYSSTSFNFIGVGTNTPTQSVAWGNTAGSNDGFATLYIDDVAINDGTGTQQNTWCKRGKVIMLKPTADSSRVGFTTGAGGTSSLFNAVKNTPPIGVAQTSATSTSQIQDATNNATDNYVATLQTYTAAGVPSDATILWTRAVTSHGNSSTTSRTNGISSTASPVITEVTGTTSAILAADTWPTGWTSLFTAYSYAPTVTLGSAPTVKFRKGTASTDYAMASLMGMLVEYLPGTAFASSDTAVSTDAATRVFAPSRLTASYRQSVLTDSPLFYSRMDDPSGSTMTDSSTGAHNGTYLGSPTLSALGALAGDPDTAVAFNGTSQGAWTYLDLSGYNVVTVEFWLNWTTYANDNKLGLEFTANYTSNNGGWIVTPNAASTFFDFATCNTSSGLYNACRITRPSAGVYHHYAFVFDRTTASPLIAYVDGATATVTQTLANAVGGYFANDALYLMNRNKVSLFGAGSLDEVAIYGGALSASRVLAHWNAARSDNTTTTDAVTRLITPSRTISDTNTLSDSVTRTSTRMLISADTSVLSESAIRAAVVWLRLGADSSVLSDSTLRAASAWLRTSTDTSALSESAIRAALVWARTSTDASLATDASTRMATHQSTASDLTVDSDTATAIRILSRIVSENSVLTDSAIRTFIRTYTTTETSLQTDLVTRLAPHLRTTTDITATIDTLIRSAVLQRLTSDTSLQSDLVTRLAYVLFRSLTDTSVSSDVGVRSNTAHSYVSSDLSVESDIAYNSKVFRQLASDTSTLIDALVRQLVLNHIGTDLSTLSDSPVRQMPRSRIASDVNIVIDNVVRNLADSRVLSEMNLTNDQAIRYWNLVRSVMDASLVTEVAQAHATYSQYVFDISLIADSLTTSRGRFLRANDLSILTDLVRWQAQPNTHTRKVYGRGRRTIR